MNPDELRYHISMTRSGNADSEKFLRVAIVLAADLLPVEVVVEMCDEWAHYEDLALKAGAKTR
jgi:hypothetical protein